MRFPIMKLGKKSLSSSWFFVVVSLALSASVPRLQMALDTEPGNILPPGGVVVQDVRTFGAGHGLVSGMVADASGNYFTFLKYKSGSNVAWHAQKTDATGAR